MWLRLLPDLNPRFESALAEPVAPEAVAEVARLPIQPEAAEFSRIPLRRSMVSELILVSLFLHPPPFPIRVRDCQRSGSIHKLRVDFLFQLKILPRSLAPLYE